MKVALKMETEAREAHLLASVVALQALFRGRRCQQAYAKARATGKLRLFAHLSRGL